MTSSSSRISSSGGGQSRVKNSRITYEILEYTSSDEEDNRSSYLESIGACSVHERALCIGDYIGCGHGGVSQFGLPLRPRDSKLFFEPVTVSSLRGCKIRKVACGARHTVFLTEDGSVFSCGNNNLCQTGHPIDSESYGRAGFIPKPTLVEALARHSVIDVDCGLAHSAAVTNDGNLWTWGFDGNNQLGRAGDALPHVVGGALAEPFVKFVACGGDHTLALDVSGGVYAWGKGSDGALGYGVGFDHVAPKRLATRNIPTSDVVVSIAAGGNFSLALTAQGDVYAWGSSAAGATAQGEGGGVGLTNLADVQVPTLIKGLRGVGVVSIFAGWNHAGAITSAGHLYTWGQCTYGQLGLGELSEGESKTCVRTPTRVRGNLTGQRVVQGSAGQYSTAVITDMREMISFGYNRYGQLGNGRDDKRIFDPKFSVISGPLSAVACGSDHSIVLPHICIPSAVGNAMLSILNKRIFADVKFLIPNATDVMGVDVVEGKSVAYGHQFILRSRSEVFRDMFTPPMADAVCTIEEDVTYHGFHSFLQFLYTDYVEVTHPNASDLELLSERYQVSRLMELVSYHRSCSGGRAFGLPKGFTTCLEADLATELNVEDQSDVIFLLGSNLADAGHIIHAHKALLYARAPEMCKAMHICLDGMDDDELEVEVVVVEAHIDIPAFMRILRFIYTDQMRVPPHQAIDILSVSHSIRVPRRCSDMCENVLISQYLMTENVGFVLTTANTYRCSRLREACLDLIERQWDQLASMSFMGIPIEDIHCVARRLGKMSLFNESSSSSRRRGRSSGSLLSKLHHTATSIRLDAWTTRE